MTRGLAVTRTTAVNSDTMPIPALPLTNKSKTGGRPRDDRAPENAFGAWLRTCGMTAGKVSEKIGKILRRPDFSTSSVYNMRNGYFKPGRDLAVAIEKLTKGKVRVESWDESKARPRKVKGA